MDYNSQGANAQNPAFNSTETTADFYRKIAEHLMRQQGRPADANLMKTRGAWAQSIPDVVNALNAGRYADLARQQDLNLRNPGGQDTSQVEPGTVGGQLMKGAGSLASKLASYWQGGGEKPQQPTGDKDLTTGSNAPPEVPSDNLGPSKANTLEEGAQPEAPKPGPFGTSTSAASPINDDYVRKLIAIESGGSPTARTGSNRGLGQFGPREEKKYGITEENWKDPNVQTSAIKAYAEDARKHFIKEFGREPTQGELYLLHQQGLAGGTAMLKNPDKPAFESIAPYYKDRQTALSAIQGNIPMSNSRAKDNPEGVTGKEFANMWTQRFDRAGGVNVRSVPTQAIPGVMPPSTAPGEPDSVKPNYLGAGGVPPNPGEPSAVELAGGDQLFNTQTAKESPTSKTIDIPGYKGPAPDVKYLESKDEIHAQMMRGSPSDAQQVFAKWRERHEPYEVEVPNGRLQITPREGGGGDYKFIASGKPESLQPGQVPIYPEVGKDGQIDWKMKVPGANGPVTVPGAKGATFEDAMKKYTEITRYFATQAGQTAATGHLFDQSAKTVADYIASGTQASQAHQTLSAMENVSKTNPSMERGPTADYIVKAREFLNNFAPESWHVRGAAPEEVLQKLNGFLAAESTKAISASRGTNFELQTFMRQNPGLMQTKEGTEMLIDILKQEMRQRQGIARMAQRMEGKDVRNFPDMIEEYYRAHPLIINQPVGKDASGKMQFRKVTTQRIESKEDRDALPEGMGYLDPEGNPRYR